MSVYFVLRSYYEGPSAKYIRKFEETSVLEWFQHNWHLAQDTDADDAVQDKIGTSVYGFATLFEAIEDHGLAVPQTETELWETLEANLYVEGTLQCESNLVEVLTDDDELELAYFIFDDHFLATHPGRAAFVLHDGWELPSNASNPELDEISYIEEMMLLDLEPDEDDEESDEEGALYLVFMTFYDGECLSAQDGGFVLQGRRLPDLLPYLLSKKDIPEAEMHWPPELVGFRNALVDYLKSVDSEEKGFAQALLDQPEDKATWSAYSDWLQDQGRRPVAVELLEQALRYFNENEPKSFLAEGRSRDPSKSSLRVEAHLAQANLHIDSVDGDEFYHQWYFFDDLWFNAHPALANGLLRYARRWDALDFGEPEEEEFDEYDEDDWDDDEFDDEDDWEEDEDEDDWEEDEDDSWRDNGAGDESR